MPSGERISYPTVSISSSGYYNEEKYGWDKA